ncbi:MAG: riboflavin biosynthesis protein RibF [Dissulfurispiraceae bacterium]|jgi:riboflavin kinase/FMN adenylyltransferase|nr:riboflavin biosynthesis protein RibF [Dissulfurispiraceae bacterium]
MKIFHSIPRRGTFKNPVVTIGNFDGAHAGHQKIFSEVVKKAEETGGTPVVITFCPHPATVLSPAKDLKLISSFEVKCCIAERIGIKALICIPFDARFANIDSEAFISEILADKIGARWVIVGNNCSFGRAKQGRPALLRARGKKFGFKLKVVRYATALGKRISSTRVRSLVSKGDVQEAALALKRAYHIDGTVVKGKGRGSRILNTPTANIITENRLIPKEGVYAVMATIDPEPCGHAPKNEQTTFNAVANIGKNPTFGSADIAYEVHLLDFNTDIRGRTLRIHFIKRIRDEKKFHSPAELGIQIQKDIKKTRAILKKTDIQLYL